MAEMPSVFVPASARVAPPPLSVEELVGQISARLAADMNRKFAEFRAEIFPDYYARPPPPSGAPEPMSANMAAPAPARRKNRGGRKNRKRKAALAQQATQWSLQSGQYVAGVAQPGEVWSTVVGRRPKSKPAQAPQAARKPATLPRPPSTSAVTITLPPGSGVTMAEVMRLARSKVSLADAGFEEGFRPKRAMTGGLILRVAGPEAPQRAEMLKGRLQEALIETGAIVARPVKMGDLRVRDLEDSTVPAEVASAVAAAGECSVDDIKVGEIRSSAAGLGTAWVRCPLVAARKIAAAGRLRVGWMSSRVEALAARPLQCFRCLERGHVRAKCTCADRSGLCFVCGRAGHMRRDCTETTPRCAVCADLGRPSAHRLGSRQCTPPKKRGASGRAATAPAPAAPAAAEAPASVTGENSFALLDVGDSGSVPSVEAMEA